jgi:hypothetical protein
MIKLFRNIRQNMIMENKIFVIPTERSDEESHYGISHFVRNDTTLKL